MVCDAVAVVDGVADAVNVRIVEDAIVARADAGIGLNLPWKLLMRDAHQLHHDRAVTHVSRVKGFGCCTQKIYHPG